MQEFRGKWLGIPRSRYYMVDIVKPDSGNRMGIEVKILVCKELTNDLHPGRIFEHNSTCSEIQIINYLLSIIRSKLTLHKPFCL